MVRLALVVMALTVVGCGGDDRRPARDGGPGGDTTLPDGFTPDTSAAGCTPGQTACTPGGAFYTCGADGMTHESEMQCDAGCDPSAGCGACVPNSRRCEGETSMVCNSAGTDYVTARDCTENGTTCSPNGYCNDACGTAESTKSNIGCEYWPTPLSNNSGLGENDRYDFRAVIANPGTLPANIRVFRGLTMLASITVAAGGLQDVVLPWVEGQSNAINSETWTSVVVADGAMRLISDQPVTVAQFNPFEYDNGEEVPDPSMPLNPFATVPDYSYTNDASLLLPAHAFTGDYIVSSYVPLSRTRSVTQDDFLGNPQTRTSSSQQPGYVTIVGTTPEPTMVAVSLSAPIVADAGGRFPAASRGNSINFILARGEAATIFAAAPPDCVNGRPGFVRDTTLIPAEQGGGRIEDDFCNENEFDLTGSRISASNPVGVFGGHQCAYVPYNAQACDHLENQLPPLQTWGQNFVSAPLGEISNPGINLVRVMAANDGTTVTVSPAQDGVSELTLGAGEWREFRATSAFEVTGSQGILVTQFMVGQALEDAERGDPAMVVLSPQEQFRSDYTFVAPTSYNAGTMGQNFILVVREPGQDIMLDGGALGGNWARVGSREWAIVPITGGTHQMSSSAQFGVTVYGLGLFTSYAYPAGMNLEEIFLI